MAAFLFGDDRTAHAFQQPGNPSSQHLPPARQALFDRAVQKFGVTVQKSTAAPLILFSVFSPGGTYDSKFLANYCFINLNSPITRVPGIASVTIFGAGQYAMRLWVNPDVLAKRDITVSEIVRLG